MELTRIEGPTFAATVEISAPPPHADSLDRRQSTECYANVRPNAEPQISPAPSKPDMLARRDVWFGG